MKKIAKDLATAGFPYWIKDKTLQVNEVKPWKDYNTGQILGKSIETVIIEDKTPYDYEGEAPYTNRFGVLAFKCRANIDIPIDSIVITKNVRAKIHGQYNNELTLYCDEFEIVGHAGQTTSTLATQAVKHDESAASVNNTNTKGKTLA